MIKISHVDILGWEHAIRGMRNPMNSWDKSDSYWTHIEDPDTLQTAHFQYFVGEADKKLMMKLAKGGPKHAKFRRMIVVFMDICAPLYWWKEFDTYKIGTVANSCSTMHRIQSKPFSMDDFSIEHLGYFDWNIAKESVLAPQPFDDTAITTKIHDEEADFYPIDILDILIESLEENRQKFLETRDKKFWWQMIQLLPSSYNQTRTIALNYEVLYSIYHDRRNHKLDEWHAFCDWIESLPHSDLITLKEENEVSAMPMFKTYTEPYKDELSNTQRWNAEDWNDIRMEEHLDADFPDAKYGPLTKGGNV